MPQSAKSHAKWDPLFHFVLAPLCLALVIVSITEAVHHRAHLLFLDIFPVLVALALLLLNMKTRLYALKNQDRIIRLEEQVRLHRLMALESSTVDALSLDQLIGLRFASDAEAPDLARRAIRENLNRKQVKEAVVTWRPDEFRA